MQVTELTCPACNTQVKGEFTFSKLDRLTSEQLQFVEVFLQCRGNIKEVERELKISYPTVRSRLEQIISDMGYKTDNQEINIAELEQVNVIEAFANGDYTFEETLEKLKGAKQL